MTDDAAPAAGPAPRRRSWVTLIPLLAFGGLAAIFLIRIIVSGGNVDFIPSALIGSPAPEFSLPPLAGLAEGGAPVPGLASDDLLGGITVVNVWASWCGPCRDEHPLLEEVAEDDRVRLVGINYKDATAGALGFLAEFGNPFAAVGVDDRGRTAIDWGVYGVPETFVVGPDGVIRHKVVGPLTPQRLANELRPAIDRVAAMPAEAAPR